MPGMFPPILNLAESMMRASRAGRDRVARTVAPIVKSLGTDGATKGVAEVLSEGQRVINGVDQQLVDIAAVERETEQLRRAAATAMPIADVDAIAEELHVSSG